MSLSKQLTDLGEIGSDAAALHKEKVKSVLWILSWAFSFTIAMSVAKSLSGDISIPIIIFIRSLFGLVFVTPFVVPQFSEVVKTNRKGLHLARVVLVALALGCTYYAYRNLPIAVASTIGFTGPLITTLLAVLFLKDKVTPQRWGLIILGYASVLLVVHPQPAQLSFPLIIDLIGNLAMSISIIVTKRLSSTESSLRMLFFSTVASTIIGGGLALMAWNTPDMTNMIKLLFVGSLGAFSQFSYLQSLKYGKPSFVAPFEYSRLVLAIPIGFFFFNEVPNIMVLMGATLIIFSTYLLTVLEMKDKN